VGKKSSKRWLRRQRRDRFAQAARSERHLSRAHYKIQQLDSRFKLLGNRHRVLELGAAPGGWTAYLARRVTQGRIIAVDPRPIAACGHNIELVRGCVGEPAVDERLDRLLQAGAGRDGGVDLVLSDMAPNISGVRVADQARAMALVELASAAACRWLKPGGALVVKIFQGSGVREWLRDTKGRFGAVRVVKPDASRSDSRENYVVARDFHGGA